MKFREWQDNVICVSRCLNNSNSLILITAICNRIRCFWFFSQDFILDGHSASQLINQIHECLIQDDSLSDKQKSVIFERLAVSNLTSCYFTTWHRRHSRGKILASAFDRKIILQYKNLFVTGKLIINCLVADHRPTTYGWCRWIFTDYGLLYRAYEPNLSCKLRN